MTSMDPRYQGLRGQKGPHPLLEIPCTDEELREGSAGHTMMPEGSQSLVDASLYMVSPCSTFLGLRKPERSSQILLI